MQEQIRLAWQVAHEQHARRLFEQLPQPGFAFNERQSHHVASVLEQQIERAQGHLRSAFIPALARSALLQQVEVAAADVVQNAGLRLSTIVHRIAVLSKVHRLRNLENPAEDPSVKELLSRTRRAYAKRGARGRKKDALTREPLQMLLDTCDESLRGKRDRALLLFGWSTGGRRRSEIAGTEMRFLNACRDGEYTYELAHCKTNQTGESRPENEKLAVGAAADALREWLKASGIKDGAIFRRVRRGGHIGEPLSAASVRDIVRKRCALAGIDGDFSAHSLRSGFVTEACTQDVGLPEIMAMTGHRSAQTLLGYNRGGASRRAAALRLLS